MKARIAVKREYAVRERTWDKKFPDGSVETVSIG
jgi:hypothetical protein